MPQSTQPVSSNIVLPPITAFDPPAREAPVYSLHRPPQHYHYLPYPPQVPSSSSIEPRATYQQGPISYQQTRQIWPNQQYSLPQQARAPPQDHNLLLAQQPQERSNFKEVKRRTKTGCQTCRKRRIKCDEARPSCRNCLKSKRVCQGYDPAHISGQNNPSLLQPIPRSHTNEQHSLSPSTGQADSYIFHRAASISSRNSSIATEPDYGHPSDSIRPPRRTNSPGRMDELSSAHQEYPNRTLPPPDQPIRRAKRCTIDELCSVEGTPRPNLPPLPNTPPNVDAIKTIFDTAFASGLDRLLETTWFSRYAFQYLAEDLAFLAQILAYITMIHDLSQYGADSADGKLKSQEARITWALLGLCVRPQRRTSHLRCLTGRLHAISVMLTGDGIPPAGDVLFEDGEGVDDVDGTPQENLSALQKQEQQRCHEFWRAIGRVVSNSWNHSARSQRSSEDLEAMDAAARQALDECRARLDNRENRDLVYSVLNMRHLSEMWAKSGTEDVSMDGAAESSLMGSTPNDAMRQWNISRRFVELEASGRRCREDVKGLKSIVKDVKSLIEAKADNEIMKNIKHVVNVLELNQFSPLKLVTSFWTTRDEQWALEDRMPAVGALVVRTPRTKPASSPVISGPMTSVLSPSLGLWSRSSTSDTIRAPLLISRTQGSGLRVPGYANLTGEPTEDSDEST